MTQIKPKKIALITGASRGIGLSTAKKFIEQGYTVINLSRKSPPLKDIIHLNVDLAQSHFTEDLQCELQPYLQEATSISVIHNAGLLLKDSVETVQANALAQVLQVNVVAASQINQLTIPYMKADGGSSIVYIGSTLSEKAVANSCSYVVSKHAVIGLMRATCQDLVGKSIHTACVCPGFTETEMLADHVGNDQSILNAIAKGVAFGRLIDPKEIAATIFFTAVNPVVNGSVIHANLGQIES